MLGVAQAETCPGRPIINSSQYQSSRGLFQAACACWRPAKLTKTNLARWQFKWSFWSKLAFKQKCGRQFCLQLKLTKSESTAHKYFPITFWSKSIAVVAPLTDIPPGPQHPQLRESELIPAGGARFTAHSHKPNGRAAKSTATSFIESTSLTASSKLPAASSATRPCRPAVRCATIQQC